MTDDTPASLSEEQAAMAEPWALVTALLGGTFAMRQAGKQYLPRHPAESQEAYDCRLKSSTLYNAFARTIETMAGKPFSEPIKQSEDMPPAIAGTDTQAGYAADIDLEGRDLQRFAHDVFRKAMAYGMSHILVDYPPVVGVRNLAEQRQTGARPYFVHIDPRSVLGWRAERINGVQTLTQLRFLESVRVPDGQWKEKTVQQVRVLEPTRYAIYRKNERDEWALWEEGPVSLGAIPLATVYAKRTGFMTGEPPLMDLAHLNVEHWVSSSDQRNILRVARVPILFAPGFGDTEMKIGAVAISSDNPQAKLEWVEHSGAAIGAGREDLKDIEERMAVMGLELLISKPGTKTATEATIDTVQATSTLAAMVQNLEDSLAQALQFMADWDGLETGGSVELQGDFTKLDPLDVATLVQARESGILSAETAFRTFQTLGMIDEEIEWEEEAARISTDQAAADKREQAKTAAGQDTTTPPSPRNSGDPAPAADFGPLLDGIQQLVAAMGDKPEALDLQPLVAAIQSQPITVSVPDNDPADIARAIGEALAKLPQPQAIDLSPLLAAIAAIQPPNVTITMPEQPAPVVNVTPAPITVNTPPVNVTVERGMSKAKFTTDQAGDITGVETVQ